MTSMQRILIVGICGAGKSTLASALAGRLGLPLIHLDREYWQPGWTMPDRDWWHNRVQELVSGDRWVMDGSYASTLHYRLPRADTVIHLDFPRRIAMYRIFKRILHTHGQTRPDMADGCPEQFDWEFVKYAWAFPQTERVKFESALAELGPGQTLIRLQHPRDVVAFLNTLSR
ncbi:MAG: AAA family ATPase [Candidatus Hydrogenedentes bacterium]|nr:AAA family ATPase [Candidatus Hydrogenedentota bacterium]